MMKDKSDVLLMLHEPRMRSANVFIKNELSSGIKTTLNWKLFHHREINSSKTTFTDIRV